MLDIKVRLGNHIKELRKTRQMSQEELAFRADMDRSYITSLERGHRNVAITNLEKIANALEITLSELTNC